MRDEITSTSWFIKKIKANLPNGQFARAVTVLAGGTALGQIIAVLASPVLTRLYTPDDFGVLAVYISILGIISVVASWRYEIAIPLPEKDEDAANLLALSLSIVLFMTIIAGLSIWILGGRIILWANAPALQSYLWLLPVGIILVGTYQVLNYWAVRKQAFGKLAKTKFYQGLGAVLTQIGFGASGLGPLGLLIGQMFGQSAGITTLLTFMYNSNKEIGKSIHVDRIKWVAMRYQRFPKLSILPAAVNSLSLQLPTLVLSTMYGSSVVGWLALVNKVLGTPLSLIVQATTQVTLGQYGERSQSNHTLEPLFWKVIRQQSILGLPLLLLVPICPFVFPALFSQAWTEAGTYAAIWLPSLVANFITSPTGVFLDILERQDLFLMREIIRLGLFSGVLAVLILLRSDAVDTVLAFSGAMTLFAFFYAAISLYAIRHAG